MVVRDCFPWTVSWFQGFPCVFSLWQLEVSDTEEPQDESFTRWSPSWNSHAVVIVGWNGFLFPHFDPYPRKGFFWCKWIEQKMVLYVFFTCVFYLNPPKPQIVGMSSSSHLFVQFDKCFAKDFEDYQHLKESGNPCEHWYQMQGINPTESKDMMWKARARTQWHYSIFGWTKKCGKIERDPSWCRRFDFSICWCALWVSWWISHKDKHYM